MYFSSLAALGPIFLRGIISGVEPDSEDRAIAAAESRAFLEAVERHDRLLEAQRLAAENADGDLNGEHTGRGFEAKIATGMKERGDPG